MRKTKKTHSEASEKPLLQVIQLQKEYHQGDIAVPALKKINFELQPGEFAAIIGPSGSGKSTLLNIIGALDTATAGEVIFDGIHLTGLDRKQLADFRLHKLGFVFQAYNLIPVFTAFENIEYVLNLQKVEKLSRRQRIQALLKSMGLSELGHRFPRELSGGQQQRVAVARALVTNAKLILADEPTANLDTENAHSLLTLMEKMSRELGTAFLFSTHDHRVIEKAARILRVEDGVLISDERKKVKNSGHASR